MTQSADPSLATSLSGATPLTAAIAIGTYNQAQYLRSSIESALAQTYPIQEIWVVDDASTDDTPAVMERALPAKVSLTVHYHRHASNVGPARNLVLGACKAIDRRRRAS